MFASSTAKDGSAGETKEAMRKACKDTAEAADTIGEDIKSAANRIGQQVHDLASSTGDNVTDAAKALKEKIRGKPIQSSLIALGVGFILGLLCRR